VGTLVDHLYHIATIPSGGDREMGLNLKNQEVERLAAEVAALVGETKTEAIRRALEERKQRLSFPVNNRERKARLKSLLESEIWPLIPKKLLGKRSRHCLPRNCSTVRCVLSGSKTQKRSYLETIYSEVGRRRHDPREHVSGLSRGPA